ncbi:MAG: LysR substrate-binding domain-containing protein [Thermoleophilaceae bacterium]
MPALTVAFDERLPHARWGPMFHVFRLERPDVTFEWKPVGFPQSGRELLEGADVGLFLQPTNDDRLRALTLDESPMVVIMAVGHPLATSHELTVADLLDQPFPGGADLHPEWSAFWTFDEQRGGPPRRTDDAVHSAEEGTEVVAQGRAVATVPDWVASGLSHPGIVALGIRDAPSVKTRLLWRADDDRPVVQSLVNLASAWTREARGS